MISILPLCSRIVLEITWNDLSVVEELRDLTHLGPSSSLTPSMCLFAASMDATNKVMEAVAHLKVR